MRRFRVHALQDPPLCSSTDVKAGDGESGDILLENISIQHHNYVMKPVSCAELFNWLITLG
jgi:hypothetical protein